jgi:hypothetical protein
MLVCSQGSAGSSQLRPITSQNIEPVRLSARTSRRAWLSSTVSRFLFFGPCYLVSVPAGVLVSGCFAALKPSSARSPIGMARRTRRCASG